MKPEYKIKDRYCSTHGVKMRVNRIKDEFNRRTGAIENKSIFYECPKWFCGEKAHEFAIFNGQVA